MPHEVDIAATAKYLKCITSQLNISEPDTFTIIKLVYLIQEWGINLGYRYGWFIYNPLRFEGPYTIGPYSTQLLYYLDEIESELKRISNPCEQIDEDEKYRLNSIAALIKYLMDTRKGTRKSLQYILELITSTHFTITYGNIPGTLEDKIKRLTEVKNELAKEDIEEVVGLLQKVGVI